MNNYVSLSLETHLFFARIMKEHGLFLEAGFPCAQTPWIKKADWFRQEFENLLRDVVRISDRRVSEEILNSGELVTEYTISAERRTQMLGGVPIDSSISERQKNLNPKLRGNEWHSDRRNNRRNCYQCDQRNDWDKERRELEKTVDRLNERALKLLEEFIEFKQNILDEVSSGKLFNANYPLLVEHILREAKLYCTTVKQLLRNEELTYKDIMETEKFWNRIMMEHALFIRGLLDPTEEALIATADQFAMDYKELLEKAKQQDCKAMNLTEETLKKTYEYRDFKAAGTEGILDCKIASIILPLLADHVLREANHFIRLLQFS